MNPRFKRTKILVNRRVQGRVVLHVLYLWAAYHLVLWHVMLFFRVVQYGAERLNGGAALTFSQLFAEFVHNHYSMIICGAIVLPYLIWDVLKLTHRFVGPFVQFQRTLARLARGEKVTEVRIRTDDFLGELQDAFNEFLRASPLLDREAERLPAQVAQPRQPTESDDAQAVLAGVEEIKASVSAELDPAEHAPSTR
jgi:hypothetical protein